LRSTCPRSWWEVVEDRDHRHHRRRQPPLDQLPVQRGDIVGEHDVADQHRPSGLGLCTTVTAAATPGTASSAASTSPSSDSSAADLDLVVLAATNSSPSVGADHVAAAIGPVPAQRRSGAYFSCP